MFATTRVGIFAGAVFTILLLLAAIGDVRTRRIPNRLVVGITLAGLGYSAFAGGPLWGTLQGLEGFFVGLAVWLPFYIFGWLGAGDVKLVAAGGAWLGPAGVLEGSLIAALSGAILALLFMIRARGWRESVETLGVATTVPGILAPSPVASKKRALPYGVPIAVGALCAGWIPGLLIR